jgi:hypothetical protein
MSGDDMSDEQKARLAGKREWGSEAEEDAFEELVRDRVTELFNGDYFIEAISETGASKLLAEAMAATNAQIILTKVIKAQVKVRRYLTPIAKRQLEDSQ